MKHTIAVCLLILKLASIITANTSITSQPNRPSPAVFQSGENITLTCSSSTPSPSYTWSTSFTDSDGVAAPVSSPSINGIYLHGANIGDHTCTVGDQTATYSLTVKGASVWYKNPNPGHLLLNNTAISVYTYINEIRCYTGDTSNNNSATTIISPNDDSSAPLSFTNDEAGLVKKTGETTITTIANGVYTCQYVGGSGIISEISFAVYGRNREYNSDSNTGISLVVQSIQYTIDQENITVTCISSGWPATQVTWIRDGVIISSGATGYVMKQEVQDRSSSRYKNDLVIDNSISVLGTYICEVKAIRHNDDIISSDTGLVNVQSAGSIFVVVTTMGSPEVGEDYHLNCTITKLANETLSVVWLKDNVTITNSSTDMTLGALENNHTYVSLVLSLSPVRLSHTGQYSCEARGSSDVGRATVQVLVKVPLFLDPSDTIFTLGDTVNLTCSIGLPATLSGTVQSVTWYKDSTPFTNGVTNTLNDGLSTVDLGNILTDEAGNYTCMMLVISPYINNGPQLIISNSTNITVQLPLPTSLILGFTILSPPFYAGTDRDLQCRALINTYNDPHVTVNINILFDGSSIPTEFRKRLSSLDASENNIYGRTVQIQYLVASQDSGNYTCIATIDSSIESSYIIDTSVSTTKSFNIQAPVPIVDLTSSSNRIPFNASGSNTVSLYCSGIVPIYDDVFLSFPKTVAWSLNGSAIPGSPTSPTTPHQVFSNSLLEYSFSMAGSYVFTCRYSVSIPGDPVATSSDTLTITVTPPSVPNPPINITAANIQYNRATINWILTDIAYTLESYVVYYGLTSDGLNETSSVLNEGLNYDSMNVLLSIELLDLEPDSMYYYIISSTNTEGSVNSSIGSFRITGKPPTAPPEGFTMTTISSTSISFEWSPPPLDHINGLLVSYTLNCTDSLSNDCPPPSNLSFPLVINQNSSVNIILDGFRPGTTVTCNVAASNQAGISPYATSSAVTNEEHPSGSPQFSILTTEPREFTISWSPLNVCLRNGNITSYMFTCVEIDSNQVPSSHPISLVTSPAVVGGLRPFTSYNCHLVAVNSAGQSDPVNMEGMTEPDVPTGPPRDFTFSSLNSTVIRLSWLPIDETKQNGLINSYNLSCNHSDAPPILVPVDDSLETTRGYYTHAICGLTPFTLYRCTIFADNTVGSGSIAVVIGRTNEDVPGDPPTIISLISYTPYSLTVKWLPPLAPNGIITHYTFYDVSSDPPMVLDVTNDPSQFEITGLSPYHLLTIRVSASTSVGEGPLSEPVTNRTLHTIPNPVQDIVLTPTSQSTLIVSVPEQSLSVANGIITEYDISIVQYTGDKPPQRILVDATNDSIQVTFDELISLIPYNVTIIAINMEGPGIPRTIIVFTEEGTPPKPRNVTVTRINDESMIVRWNIIPITEARGLIRNYHIMYKPYPAPDGMSNVTVPGNMSSVNIDGLIVGVSYSVSVRAVTGAGAGNASDVIIVLVPADNDIGTTGIIVGLGILVALIITLISLIIILTLFLLWFTGKGRLSLTNRENIPMNMNTVYGITSRQEDNNDIIMCTNIIYETANKQSIAADREYETLDYEEIPVKSPAIVTTKFT